MNSIHTNTSAISALQTLRSTDSSLAASQQKISSGYRVENAADNAAYWSISTTMRSDNKSIGAVYDALGLASSILDVTTTAAEAAIDLMSDFTSRLVAASEPGVDKNKVNLELTQLKQQLQSTMDSATFSGQNWLSWNTLADSADKQIVGSFVRDSSGNVRIETLTYEINTPPPRDSTDVQYFVDNGGSGEYGILTTEAFAVEANTSVNYVLLRGETAPPTAIEIKIDDSTSNDEIGEMIIVVEAMTRRMVDMATQLGALKNRVDTQADFSKELMDAISKGVGRLVDANMDEESTRLKALQTQKQLGIQALSIANSNTDSFISLLR
jgi:flagellin